MEDILNFLTVAEVGNAPVPRPHDHRYLSRKRENPQPDCFCTGFCDSLASVHTPFSFYMQAHKGVTPARKRARLQPWMVVT